MRKSGDWYHWRESTWKCVPSCVDISLCLLVSTSWLLFPPCSLPPLSDISLFQLSSDSLSDSRFTGRHGGIPRTAFYNTREGETVINQARAELSARAKPVDSNTHRSTVQDNRQRAYHGECVLPCDLANLTPATQAHFTEYPLQEYNRFNVETRSWSGPSTHPRLKSVPYSKPNGSSMDVPRRHDLVKNLKKNKSISNYDHGLPFLAKHTNNLVSCWDKWRTLTILFAQRPSSSIFCSFALQYGLPSSYNQSSTRFLQW